MAIRRKERGGPSAAVTSLNEIPLDRELIVETDTAKLKVGDGVTQYNDLPYLNGDTTVNNYNPTITGGNIPSLAGYANLPAALTAIGSTPTTLLLDADATISTNVTIPATLRLHPLGGAKFTKSGTGTLTFEDVGIIGDPQHQLFSGFSPGDVTWTGGYPDLFRPEWWGAVGDNATDDLDAFDQMFAAMETRTAVFFIDLKGGAVKLTSGKVYYLSGVLRVNRPVKMFADGGDRYRIASALRFPAGSVGVQPEGSSTIDGIQRLGESAQFAVFENFGIYGHTSAPDNVVVDVSGLTLTLKGTGSITSVSQFGNNSGTVTPLGPGYTVNLNGFNYVVSTDISASPTTTIPLDKPRIYVGPNGTSTVPVIGNCTSADWIGQDIIIDGVTYEILSVTSSSLTLDATCPVSSTNTGIVQGINTLTDAAARLNIYHGFNPKIMVQAKGIRVSNFAGNGVNLYSNAFPTAFYGSEPNNDLSRFENVSCEDNAGSNFLISGINSQPMQFDSCNSETAGGWGFYEEGSSGVVIISSHTAYNTHGGYRMGGQAAGNLLLMPYSEGGQPQAIQGQYTLAIGGINYVVDANVGNANQISTSEGQITTEGVFSMHRRGSKYYNGALSPIAVKFQMGANSPGGLMSFGAGNEDINISAGGTDNKVVYPAYIFGYDQIDTIGIYNLYYSSGGSYSTDQPNSVIAFTSSESAHGGGKLMFPNGFSTSKVVGNNPASVKDPTVKRILSATATLNFDLTAAASQDLTVTVTDAALGDVVSLGVPHGSVTADTLFFAWVSAADTVTVRATRIAGTPNPASGTFRVMVTKF